MGGCSSKGGTTNATSKPNSKDSKGADHKADAEEPRKDPKDGGVNGNGHGSPTNGRNGAKVGPKDSTKQQDRPVLGRYKVLPGKENIMGKGTSSICYRAQDIQTGKLVAVKVYKEQQAGGKIKESTMQKYKRQIGVLKELMEPWKAPADPSLWNKELQNIQPSEVFMQLLDYSKDKNGEPGPDPADGMLYVVSELAQYSLKDYLADRREKKKPLSQAAVRDFSKRVVLALAGLHAKGFVHLDMKPENLMVFDGRLKVIDVDGCVRIGTKISINDSSISFSPCYCSPEWARFIIKDSSITAVPGLDVWSVGMTLCEFVTLDAIWKAQYANFMKNASNPREAGFLFLEWVSDLKAAPLPRSVEHFDKGLLTLLQKTLLVCDHTKRSSCAQAMSTPYLDEGGWSKYTATNKLAVEAEPTRRERDRRSDESTGTPYIKGTLFKLNSNSDPKSDANWIKRDMWLAQNFSLCYYSVKENKRLVLVDGELLSKSMIKDVAGVARDFAFEITTSSDEDQETKKFMLSAETAEDREAWKEAIDKATHQGLMKTFKLGAKMAEEVKEFKLAVRNRRMKVDEKTDAFEPLHRDTVWKLKTGGDNKNEEHWFKRDMWIAKNGSLVYYSPKEERNLVYYTAKDIANATIKKAPDGHACRNCIFIVQLAPTNDIEFEPGEFSCESEEKRDAFLKTLKNFATAS